MMPAAYREASGDRASVKSVDQNCGPRVCQKRRAFPELGGVPKSNSAFQIHETYEKHVEKMKKPLNSSRLRSEGIVETISNSEAAQPYSG